MFDFSRLEKAGTQYEANRILFEWLSDDGDRAALYQCLRGTGRVIEFQSRADTKIAPSDPSVFSQEAYLLTARSDIVRAFTRAGEFSNQPYQALGSGTFMLGLDGEAHARQREFAVHAFEGLGAAVLPLAALAFESAAVLPLKNRDFDLTELAEQAALRFVGLLYGYPAADHPLLEAVMRKAYHALNYQILGRHFVTDPIAVPEAAGYMGKLLQRTAEVIDGYRSAPLPDDIREFKDELARIALIRNIAGLKDFGPICERLGGNAGDNSGTELAVIVVGSIAGIIGNVQASVSIAINELFKKKEIFERARAAACVEGDELEKFVMEALRLNPPAAFLHRRTSREIRIGETTIPKEANVILAMGAATRDISDDPDEFKEKRDPDKLIFGGAPHGEYIHNCIGDHIAKPLITHIVRRVLLLPGLDRTRDPISGETRLLKKLWGFGCAEFPLQYSRDKFIIQQPLNVIMNVKMPISEHAETLKTIIRVGAPRIELELNLSGHVHFAQFLFLENDTKLALFTIYDGNFDAYIEFFAREVGPLFDKVFEHIQDAPPTPTKDFPKEFVDTIRRYNATPAGGYFYSAYPPVTVAAIRNAPKKAGA